MDKHDAIFMFLYVVIVSETYTLISSTSTLSPLRIVVYRRHLLYFDLESADSDSIFGPSATNSVSALKIGVSADS